MNSLAGRKQRYAYAFVTDERRGKTTFEKIDRRHNHNYDNTFALVAALLLIELIRYSISLQDCSLYTRILFARYRRYYYALCPCVSLEITPAARDDDEALLFVKRRRVQVSPSDVKIKYATVARRSVRRRHGVTVENCRLRAMNCED